MDGVNLLFQFFVMSRCPDIRSVEPLRLLAKSARKICFVVMATNDKNVVGIRVLMFLNQISSSISQALLDDFFDYFLIARATFMCGLAIFPRFHKTLQEYQVRVTN